MLQAKGNYGLGSPIPSDDIMHTSNTMMPPGISTKQSKGLLSMSGSRRPAAATNDSFIGGVRGNVWLRLDVKI